MQNSFASRITRIGLALLLIGCGYGLGKWDPTWTSSSHAQPPADPDRNDGSQTVDLAKETVQQIQIANDSLALAMEALRLEGKYNPATSGMNPYLILSGGGDAIEDLERGIGVDPITFAELYAGMALREVGDEITRDEQNRLLYKNKLIRMYSVERMQSRAEMAQSILKKRVLP
ncbi:MAG: hypothetical protein KDA78_06690 [Planctomycetaceae bacterium]|nr:hypothetical protein [Planctomycetaceae bacterium]